jgi:hypothetical protein
MLLKKYQMTAELRVLLMVPFKCHFSIKVAN